MNGVVLDTEREKNAGTADRHSAVDVVGEANRNNEINKRWLQPTEDRLSSVPSGDRSNLLRSHAAKSAECSSQSSPKARRVPRESRRVSLAQASGYVQLNQYRLLEPIGQGSYGIVKLAYSEEDDTHYAMKILSKRKLMRRAGLFGKTPPRRPGPSPPDPLQRVYREIAVLKKLDHPNVVKLVEVLDDPAEDQLYLVFQLLEGGPVINIPTDNPLSEELARKYFRDAVLGVEYLHYQRIAHRDIKPANLLLGDSRVQVADLGASGELAGAAGLAGAVGTPAFRAPEAAASADRYVGEAADIWSLGVTLYAMVTGKVPWMGSSVTELQRRIISEPLSFPPRPHISRPLKRLLFRMLDKDPVTRATMQEIKEHEWVTSDGKEPLPSEQENCRLVEVTDEDMARVVTSIPNLSTLILIKTMLKKHSFQNPFLRSREGSNARRESTDAGETGTTATAAAAATSALLRKPGLARSGRSLSAPGNYLTNKQLSFDIGLESVQESKERVDGHPPNIHQENSSLLEKQSTEHHKIESSSSKSRHEREKKESESKQINISSTQSSEPESSSSSNKGSKNSKESSLNSQDSTDSTNCKSKDSSNSKPITTSGNDKETIIDKELKKENMKYERQTPASPR